jgi:hypothetical protein
VTVAREVLGWYDDKMFPAGAGGSDDVPQFGASARARSYPSCDGHTASKHAADRGAAAAAGVRPCQARRRSQRREARSARSLRWPGRQPRCLGLLRRHGPAVARIERNFLSSMEVSYCEPRAVCRPPP